MKSASLRPTKTIISHARSAVPPVDPKWAPGRSSEASSTPGDRGTGNAAVWDVKLNTMWGPQDS